MTLLSEKKMEGRKRHWDRTIGEFCFGNYQTEEELVQENVQSRFNQKQNNLETPLGDLARSLHGERSQNDDRLNRENKYKDSG